jgi:UDP-galactopyranose mutase
MGGLDMGISVFSELMSKLFRKGNGAMELQQQSELSKGFNSKGVEPDLICFSHLRWDFVFQRPQHLLSRAALKRRVYFIEEPIFGDGSMRHEIHERENGVRVVVPHLPQGLHSDIAIIAVLKEMIHRLFQKEGLTNYLFWYYTPMALPFTEHFKPLASIYDCMDELSAFKGAPTRLQDYERKLFQSVDLVFTGGQSLYEAKRQQHKAVHAFPSSIDVTHFQQARQVQAEPPDQKDIPFPRLGFFGVIDERFDIQLLDQVATMRPDWHFVMIGPVVKIHPGTLPQRANIHYLGPKKYNELPRYLAGWDIALLLFARNESTRFISPTKTPEYLAAGKPVISTSIRDVVRPYGDLGLVRIADSPVEFIKAAEELLANAGDAAWLRQVDHFLAGMSWDQAWTQMWSLVEHVAEAKRANEWRTEAAIDPKPGMAQAATAS